MAGRRFGFATVGLLRGEPQQTPTVVDLQACGMQLHWLGYGTRDCSQGPAMTATECAMALRNGAALVRQLPGNALVHIGLVGRANASARAIATDLALVQPQHALEVAQDRLNEKQFVTQLGGRTAPYMAVDTPEDLEEALTAATAIAPHTRAMFMRAASVEMRKPKPAVGEPKNSATMAPIRARVALTFRALKMKGSATGRRRSSRVRR